VKIGGGGWESTNAAAGPSTAQAPPSKPKAVGADSVAALSTNGGVTDTYTWSQTKVRVSPEPTKAAATFSPFFSLSARPAATANSSSSLRTLSPPTVKPLVRACGPAEWVVSSFRNHWRWRHV